MLTVQVAIACTDASPPLNVNVGGFFGSYPDPATIILTPVTTATIVELTVAPDGIQHAGLTVKVFGPSIL